MIVENCLGLKERVIALVIVKNVETKDIIEHTN